jgi:hypothetical protein
MREGAYDYLSAWRVNRSLLMTGFGDVSPRQAETANQVECRAHLIHGATQTVRISDLSVIRLRERSSKNGGTKSGARSP